MDKDKFYFPHDFNANSDEKILFIRSKFGMEGYGLYWYFIETMHESKDSKLTCALIDGIAHQLNIDITVLKDFYNSAITVELFVTDGVKYWSERVVRNKEIFNEKRNLKSLAGKKGMEIRWKNNNVITDDNGVITKHNKGKESKVNKSNINNNKSLIVKQENNQDEEVFKPSGNYRSQGEELYAFNVAQANKRLLQVQERRKSDS
jgi:nitrogen fixation protein FixH